MMKLFNKFKIAFLVPLIAMCLTGCAGCTRVGPGYVGIKTIQSGSARGVQDYPAQTGWVWYNPFTEDVLEYPIFVQTAVWTKNVTEGNPLDEEITFTTKDKMVVSADISLAYTLENDKVPAFYVKFRNDDINGFTHGFLRNLAREKFDSVAGKYSVDQIMGDNAPYLLEVRTSLQSELDKVGVKFEQLGFIGAPRPPASVTESINETAKAAQMTVQKANEVLQADQDAKSKLVRANADAQSRIINAEAEAKANRLLSESLTTNLVEYKKLEKWNGVLPSVTTGANSGIMLGVPGK